jgi:hypothetical protein
MLPTRQPLTFRRVIVSSPSDVIAERRLVNSAVETVNAALEASKQSFRLRLYKWETDVPPGPHPQGGQGRIESQLSFDECDILIGIFWKRFGTPTLGSDSGTAREIELAYNSWEQRQRPFVMLFFSTMDYSLSSEEDCEQVMQVLGFKRKWQSRLLTADFNGPPDFERVLTKFLLIECLGNDTATSAFRSGLSCRAMCSPLNIRGEGLAERVGDLKLILGGPQPVSSVTELEIDVKLNTDLAWPVGGPGPVLVVDSVVGLPITIEGIRLDRNTVRFRGVRSTGGILTIVNLRVDALRLAIATPYAVTHLLAYIQLRDGIKEVPTADAVTTVALVRQGMNFTTSGAARFSKATGINSEIRETGGAAGVGGTFTIRFAEGFPSAFKNHAEEAGVSVHPIVQTATSGTRLMMALSNIPNGVAIYVATRDTTGPDGGANVKLVQTQAIVAEPDSSLRTSGFAALRTGRETPIAQLSIQDRTATAVWEWISVLPALLNAPRVVNLDVILVADPNAAEVGTAWITGSLAPLITHEQTLEIRSPLVPSFGIYQAAHLGFLVE